VPVRGAVSRRSTSPGSAPPRSFCGATPSPASETRTNRPDRDGATPSPVLAGLRTNRPGRARALPARPGPWETATTRLMSVVWATVINRVVARSPVLPTFGDRWVSFLAGNGVVAPNDDLDGAGSCECGPGLGSPRPRHGPGPSYTFRVARGCAKPPSPEDRHQRGSKRNTPPTTATISCHRLLGEYRHPNGANPWGRSATVIEVASRSGAIHHIGGRDPAGPSMSAVWHHRATPSSCWIMRVRCCSANSVNTGTRRSLDPGSQRLSSDLPRPLMIEGWPRSRSRPDDDRAPPIMRWEIEVLPWSRGRSPVEAMSVRWRCAGWAGSV
jgi:hypothetical protein